MDIVYARGEASGQEIGENLPNSPTRGAMRIMLRTLEAKGHLRHYTKGRQFIYQPTQSRRLVGPAALRRVVDTFFGGSIRKALAAHLAQRNVDVPDEELQRLARLIEKARNKGR